MDKINIPRPFQELFGKKTTKIELIITLVFAFLVSAVLLFATYEEWAHLELWRQILIAVVVVDIVGGVVANFSYGTNLYYAQNKKARLTFILIHIQPILLALLIDSSIMTAIVVTLYTMIAAFAVNSMVHYPAQRVIGATLMLVGVTTLGLIAGDVPKLLMVLFAFHIFKVVYAFAVDHYAPRNI